MKIGRTIKFIFAILIIISSIITTTQFIIAKNWTKGLQTFASITTAATFCYQEFDEVYALVNRCKGWILNKTVKFSVGFYTFNENISLSEIQEALNSSLKKMNFSICEGRDREIDELGQLNTALTTSHNLNIDFKVSRNNMDGIYNFNLVFQISSREIENSWKIANDFRNNLFNRIDVGDRSRNDIEIDMSKAKINPFYKLTIKTIKAKDVTDFELSADVSEDLQIKLHQYKLYATSSKVSDLEKLIKEYVPLAMVS